jgi:succinyl-CoA synthetase beta subunit
MLGKEIKGVKVDNVLVEEKLAVHKEFYCGVIINDSWKVKGPVLIFSSRGGTGIEEIARQYPNEVARKDINILRGIDAHEFGTLISALPMDADLVKPMSQIVQNLPAFEKYDLRSLEVNRRIGGDGKSARPIVVNH